MIGEASIIADTGLREKRISSLRAIRFFELNTFKINSMFYAWGVACDLGKLLFHV